MKCRICLIAFLFTLSVTASAQTVEFNSAYAHVSGDGGLDGFNLGTAWWVSHRLSIAFDYDSGWDNSHLGLFSLTQAGTIVSKNHLQNFLIGPRIYFGTLRTRQKYLARLLPFAEIQMGASHLHSTLEEPIQNVSRSASDNAFSWMLGGGRRLSLLSPLGDSIQARLSPHPLRRYGTEPISFGSRYHVQLRKRHSGPGSCCG